MSRSDFDVWIDLARSGRISDDGIAVLAERLAASGERLDPSGRTADLASTGGPGSLSTLWAPAALAASGFVVPKLGVPGRPAGGIDVLSQITGYRVDLDGAQAQSVLDTCGYVHLLAGDRFAPADAELFSYRQAVGAQGVPALAIASLLSKKLAMGVKSVGLEVRVGPQGNFGADMEQARLNADRFVRVGKLVGVEAVAFLVDGTRAQQPYLGRGEALLALSLLCREEAGSWLESHVTACEGWTSAVSGSPRPSRAEVAGALSANLTAQGGSMDRLEQRAAEISVAHSRLVEAPRGGVVSYDLGRLRSAIILARAPDNVLSFDDSAGVILLAKNGSEVGKQTPLVSVRCPDSAWGELQAAVLSAIFVSAAADGTPAWPVAPGR